MADTEVTGTQEPAHTSRIDRHFHGFDGLRAIAALSVAVTHAAFLSGFNVRSEWFGPYTARLDIGVAVFFLISGFLLYRPFVMANLTGERRPEPVAYLWRRALRIFPAFWVAFTLITFVLPRVDDTVPNFTGLLAHYSLTHIYFRAHVLGPLQQSWTLATEVAFYVFLPLWACALGWIHTRVRTLGTRLLVDIAGVVLLYASGMLFRVLIETQHWEPAGMYKTWLPARIDLFALGMGLAAVSAWFDVARRRYPAWIRHRAFPWVSWGLALITLQVAAHSIGIGSRKNRGPIVFTFGQETKLEILWGLFAFFLLLPAVFGPEPGETRGAIRTFLSTRVMVWLGLISYGIYLWHEEALDLFLRQYDRVAFSPTSAWSWSYPFGLDPAFVEMLVYMLAFTIPIAAISYYVVERPSLRLKTKMPFRRT